MNYALYIIKKVLFIHIFSALKFDVDGRYVDDFLVMSTEIFSRKFASFNMSKFCTEKNIEDSGTILEIILNFQKARKYFLCRCEALHRFLKFFQKIKFKPP